MKAHMPAVAALTAVLAGCASTPEPSSAVVEVGPVLEFQVQVAATTEEQRDGLSGRQELAPDAGMLFTFEGREEREMWMAGMAFPLDVAWIVDHQVLAVDTLQPCTETDHSQCPRWASPGDAEALLEVPAGALDGIEPGTPVTIRDEPR